MSEPQFRAMNQSIRFLFAGLFLTSIVYGEEPALNVPSPNQQYELRLQERPDSDDQGVIWTYVSICGSNGKTIRELYKTNYPVIALKWHKTADAAMILEHIAGQEVMRLAVLRKGFWENIEVKQFDKNPGSFSLIDAKSVPSSFECYYMRYDSPRDEYTACRTNVNLATGEAKLLSVERVGINNLSFYKLSLDAIFFQLKSLSPTIPLRYKSSQSEDEPGWYAVRW